jgi:hypothetical protein
MTLRSLVLRVAAWIAIFVGAFSAGLTLLFETGALTTPVAEAVDSRLSGAGLSIRVGSLHWRPWSGLSLADVHLTTRDPSAAPGAGRRLASVRRLEVGYRLVDLLRADLRLTRLGILAPDVDLDALLLWSRSAAPDSVRGGRAEVPPFRVDEIRLAEGRLRAQEGDPLQALDLLGSLETDGRAWRLDVAASDAQLRAGRFDERVSASGGITLQDGIVGLEEVRVSSPAGALVLRGRLDPRGARASEVFLHAESVPVEKVGAWLGIEHPLPPALLACDVAATGRPDSLRLSGELAAAGGDDVDREIDFAGTRHGTRLELSSFRFRAGASLVDLTGRLDFGAGPAVEGVAVFRDLEPGVALADPDLGVLGDLDGVVRFAGTGLSRRTFRGSADVRIDGASAFGLRFGAGTLHLELDAGALAVEDARLEIGGSEATAAGTIDAQNRVDATLRADLDDLAVLARIGGAAAAAAPRGRGRAEAHVVGPLAAPELAGTLRLTDAALAGIDVARLEVVAEALRLGDTRVEFQAAGSGVGKGERRFDRLEAAGWVDGGELVLRSLEMSSPHATVQAAGRVEVGEEGRVEADVERLQLRATGSDARWDNAGPIRIVRTPAALEVAGLDLRGHGGSVTGGAVIGPGGATSVRASGEAVDLALFSPFLPAGEPRAGVLDFEAAGTFGADTLSADVRFDLASARWGERAIDRLQGRVSVAGDRVLLDDVALAAPALDGFAAGAIVLPAGALRGALRSREGREAALAGAVLEDVRGWLESEDLSWLWSRIPRAPVAAGAGRVEVDARGPFLAPEASLRAELHGGYIGEEPLDSFTVDAAFDGEFLTLRDGLLKTGGRSLAVTGALPLAWTAADPRPRLRPDREVDLRMQAADLPLESLSRIVPLFTLLSGEARAEAALRGRPGALRLEGSFTMSAGWLRIPSFADPLVGGVAAGTFDAGGIEIQSARFGDGHGGSVEGRGRVTLRNLKAADYAIDVTARDYHYRGEANGIRGVGSGTMRILARTASDGRTLPFFEGRFRVSRADIGEKALMPPPGDSAVSDLPEGIVAPAEAAPAPGPPPAAAPAPAVVLAEIGLRGDRNLWLKTPEMDLELAGDLVFHATERTMGITGQVHTLRGSYSVLNTRFDVQRAEVEFTDPADAGASLIDAEATTNVLDEEVTAVVTGTLAQPVIRMSTESGMSEAEIYELLALRIKRGDAAAQEPSLVGKAFRDSYLAAFTNRFGGELGRELGLDTFAYEPGEGTRSSVTVGKNVGRDFFFKYRQAVGGTDPETIDPSATRETLESPERALTIEYRLNRIFMLQGETGTLPPGDDYLNVDLRAEWGY